MRENGYILKRLDLLEKEIAQLRRLVSGEGLFPSSQLQGVIEGVTFAEEEVQEVKKSLPQQSARSG